MRQLPDAGAKRCRSRWGRVRRDCGRVCLLNVTTRLLTNEITGWSKRTRFHFMSKLPPQGAGSSFTWVRHREVMHALVFTYVLHVVRQISRSERVMYRRTVPSVQAA